MHPIQLPKCFALKFPVLLSILVLANTSSVSAQSRPATPPSTSTDSTTVSDANDQVKPLTQTAQAEGSEPLNLAASKKTSAALTVRQFQKHSTSAKGLRLNNPVLKINSSMLAQTTETKPAVLTPARPATANLGNQQRWSFSAEALFLKRGVPDVDTAVDVGTGRAFGTDDLEFDSEPGARFTIAYHSNPKTSFEVSFFGLHSWDDSALFASPTEQLRIAFISDELATQDLPDNAEDFTQALQQSIDYESKLTSVEANYRQQLTPITQKFHTTLIAGLRYFNVNEDFNLISFDNFTRLGGNIGRYDIEANNNLIGLQIGIDSGIQIVPAFGLGLKAKAGLLVNFANQDSRFVDDSDGGFVYRADEDRVGVSPMVELSGIARLDFGPSVTLQAGYQFMFLGGIATAPAQFAKSANFPGSLGRFERESVIYHGPFVGLEFRF